MRFASVTASLIRSAVTSLLVSIKRFKASVMDLHIISDSMMALVKTLCSCRIAMQSTASASMSNSLRPLPIVIVAVDSII